MQVDIDQKSGFCFGVVNAINQAEVGLKQNEEFYCLGSIVHNEQEISRLEKKGLRVVSRDEFSGLSGKKVLVRAHGEPPSTYELAKENDVELIDATCPVVLKLQERVRKAWEQMKIAGGTVIIYGKKGHAEVIGLVGQTDGNAVVVESPNDLTGIDFSKPVEIFSQTTKDAEMFKQIVDVIKEKMQSCFLSSNIPIKVNHTFCGQVANRKKELIGFAATHDVIIFVGGQTSSNGKMLFQTCRSSNPKSYYVSSANELRPEWFAGANSVGVSGATSTPLWLMEQVAQEIERITMP
ncbi:MAG TPA: 4-hydroxy-3-methylbut-2-enyl diphosphate reductase [Tenuifilaceae bacterium]|jgi:4-hydroxy-3-methylbut-2-enyl diphosphate reductase|nr:4-hydroxy-3-methylbut-2-enyl diphosphate reductase [Bacteroidales bacterium]HNY08263.1 4-hydroxy-3-methylbut-2-enyl diphosphate reductase [Tenuifilaceae bacterium]MBP8643105.1 4-hydroxy-3-methylbut-2-enyl diphosphate reductase [Bacteroidales bacterium]NLI88779.1 4-hydroxy-3-methylbut-2-enyl diphosphate reductase [Bacteroidales bacterium]HOA09439.1 4-hydroxy-3-methylbut-2-enyl diphosphate reductase [Tenuifilaceae bacterium]